MPKPLLIVAAGSFAVLLAALAQSEAQGRLRCEAIHSAAVCAQQIAR